MINNSSTAIDNLDAFLSIFPIETTNGNTVHNDIIPKLLKQAGIDLEEQICAEIIEKLIKDKYLVHESANKYTNGFYLYLTFEGRLLKETGGYRAKFLSEDAALKRANWIDDQLVMNAKRLNYLTGALVFVTVLLIVWDAVKFCFEKHKNIQDILKTL